ncbi:uncharacterized protein N7443_010154 [Penicillium atrosanguineum]|uniref:uncharacterized protein n=1 Tax=Penicillium atrosanguineum TaxID=1132637 RepID=UPI0023A59EAB|nr:uncharacterized protein N7443_010154 [Penicillium atrosanguineum]KAJ5289901.1 hypothetical protein N7443_010154 [Penicillium atrosanguineum]
MCQTAYGESAKSIPARSAHKAGIDDVPKTLDFVRDKKLRLVIKNTGLDYRGRSSAPDSLALWHGPIPVPIDHKPNFWAMNGIKKGPWGMDLAEKVDAFWKDVERESPLDNFEGYLARQT